MTEWHASPGAAVAFALLSWWFGTGAILWLVRLPKRSFGWSLPALSVLGLLGLGAAQVSIKGSGSLAPTWVLPASSSCGAGMKWPF